MQRTISKPVFGDDLLGPILLGGAFLFGVASGFLVACSGVRGSGAAAYLEAYFSSISAAESLEISALSVLWDILRWPALLVLLLAAGRIGLAAAPVLLFFRGFLLSHAITVFVVSFGVNGLFLASGIFGVSAFLVVPLMYAIGCDGLRNGRNLSGWISRDKFPLLLLCVVCVFAAAVLQGAVMPTVISALCRRLFL